MTTLDPKALIKGLLTERRIAYSPIVARAVGGATPGILLCQLMYWSERTQDEDGWIYKTQEEWEDETALTRREQETARKHLRGLEVVEERNARLEHRLYYRILWDNLLELVFANVQNVHPRMSESAIGECPKAPFDPLTETTTETTTESVPKKTNKVPEKVEVNEAFRERMRVKYADILTDVDDRIDECLAFPTTLKKPNKQLTVQGWLRRDAEGRGPPSSARPTVSRHDKLMAFKAEVDSAKG